jgi:hypothetical protein
MRWSEWRLVAEMVMVIVIALPWSGLSPTHIGDVAGGPRSHTRRPPRKGALEYGWMDGWMTYPSHPPVVQVQVIGSLLFRQRARAKKRTTIRSVDRSRLGSVRFGSVLIIISSHS